MNNVIYMDYNATTPTDKRVAEAMLPFFSDSYFNPSSFYTKAGEVRREVEKARKNVAELINADVSEIVFTSGGTESDNIAIIGYAEKHSAKGKHIITSAIEHPAVVESFNYLEKKGYEVTRLPVDKTGTVNPENLKEALRDDTVLVSIMHANNEIGVIQPLKELIDIAHSRSVAFHTDAVQSVGKIDVDVKELGVDLLSYSSHKIYGPKGVGVLYLKKGTKVAPLFHGGGQEKNIRTGTENTPGIIGLGKAAELAKAEMKEEAARLTVLRDKIQNEFTEKIPEIIINGKDGNRLHNTVNISIKYIEGEAILAFLDQHGICLSSGSACSTKSLEPSHVLLAIGLDHAEAHGSLRISLGKYTTEADVDKFIEVLPPIVERLRSMSPFWNK